ncbi:MAG: DUF2442 domain-containing protein [Gemmatimonadaceae bacterium]
MNKRSLSDAEILQRIPVARAREDADRATGLRAIAAFYDSINDLIVIETTRGIRLGFPRRVIAALRNASKEQLAQLTISPSGAGLHWDALDVQLSVPGLLIDALGPGTAAREVARRGGKSTSNAKADAARRNGVKGGRPTKKEPAPRAVGYAKTSDRQLLVKETARSKTTEMAGSRKKRG